MKLKFLGFALLAVCVCAVCCMCGSDSKTPDYEFPDGPDPDPDPQPGDYPAGLTVTEFTDDLGGGRPESQSQTALQRRASASAENPVAHSCRIRFGQPGNGLCDDQCRVLVGRELAEPACYRRCR